MGDGLFLCCWWLWVGVWCWVVVGGVNTRLIENGVSGVDVGQREVEGGGGLVWGGGCGDLSGRGVGVRRGG